LREFWLPIEAKSLITETLDDLEVTVEPGDHVELLEKLRAFRESVELPGAHSTWNEKVARTTGGVLDHEWGLELEKPGLIEVASYRLIDAMAHAKGSLQRSSAKIKVAVLEALFFAGIDFVLDLERRRIGLIENRQFNGSNFDFAGGQLRILIGSATRYNSTYTNDPLGSHSLSTHVCLLKEVAMTLKYWVKDNLRDALSVAEVEKYAPAVVAITRHPAEEDNLFAFVGGAKVAVSMRPL